MTTKTHFTDDYDRGTLETQIKKARDVRADKNPIPTTIEKDTDLINGWRSAEPYVASLLVTKWVQDNLEGYASIERPSIVNRDRRDTVKVGVRDAEDFITMLEEFLTEPEDPNTYPSKLEIREYSHFIVARRYLEKDGADKKIHAELNLELEYKANSTTIKSLVEDLEDRGHEVVRSE